MSNFMFLQTTKFIDLNNNGDETDESYGFRLNDSYESLVVDNLKEKDVIKKTNKDLILKAMSFDKIEESIEEAITIGIPLFVNGTLVEKDILRETIEIFYNSNRYYVVVFDIKWDSDTKESKKILPSSVTYNILELNIEEYESITEAISEKLTDDFGYCHKGFQFEEKKSSLF